MMPDRLRHSGPSDGPVLLLFHGGVEESSLRVPGWLLAPPLVPVLGLQRRAAAAGIHAWVLRHSVLGWNDGEPVREAREALAAVQAARPGSPIVVAGHSMGARTAVRVAEDPAVAGVVALAPWFPSDEPVDPVAGKRLRVAYAAWDHTCPFSSMATFLDGARRVADVTTRSMGNDVHAMLRRGRWARFVTEQVRDLTAS